MLLDAKEAVEVGLRVRGSGADHHFVAVLPAVREGRIKKSTAWISDLPPAAELGHVIHVKTKRGLGELRRADPHEQRLVHQVAVFQRAPVRGLGRHVVHDTHEDGIVRIRVLVG